MSSLSEVYIKKETLETLLNTLKAKGEPGLSLTISTSNDVKEFAANDKIIQQNVAVYVSQTKEQREAKKDRYYVANGRQVWDDGIVAPSLKLYKEEAAMPAAPSAPVAADEDELPF